MFQGYLSIPYCHICCENVVATGKKDKYDHELKIIILKGLFNGSDMQGEQRNDKYANSAI